MTVLLKTRGQGVLHERAILNSDAVVAALAAAGTAEAAARPWAVQAVDPATLSLREQLQLLLATDLLVTPCGGVSMLAGFLRPGAGAVFVDYWDGVVGRSRRMEASVWSHMGHLVDRYYTLDPREVRLPAKSLLGGGGAEAVMAVGVRVWSCSSADGFFVAGPQARDFANMELQPARMVALVADTLADMAARGDARRALAPPGGAHESVRG